MFPPPFPFPMSGPAILPEGFPAPDNNEASHNHGDDAEGDHLPTSSPRVTDAAHILTAMRKPPEKGKQEENKK